MGDLSCEGHGARFAVESLVPAACERTSAHATARRHHERHMMLAYALQSRVGLDTVSEQPWPRVNTKRLAERGAQMSANRVRHNQDTERCNPCERVRSRLVTLREKAS